MLSGILLLDTGKRYHRHMPEIVTLRERKADVDLLLDFPPDQVREAWNFAESACWDRGLEADLLPYDGCKPAFLAHIAPDLRILA